MRNSTNRYRLGHLLAGAEGNDLLLLVHGTSFFLGFFVKYFQDDSVSGTQQCPMERSLTEAVRAVVWCGRDKRWPTSV